MVFPQTDYEKQYELMKSSIKIGNFNMNWDLTGGLTKAQFIRRERIRDGLEPVVAKDGRILRIGNIYF